jgi:hypothetical protein
LGDRSHRAHLEEFFQQSNTPQRSILVCLIQPCDSELQLVRLLCAQQENVDCKYLLDKKLCTALINDEEGAMQREKFCTNGIKSCCCYLCDNRPACEIGCAFLDKPAVSKSRIGQRNRQGNQEDSKGYRGIGCISCRRKNQRRILSKLRRDTREETAEPQSSKSDVGVGFEPCTKWRYLPSFPARPPFYCSEFRVRSLLSCFQFFLLCLFPSKVTLDGNFRVRVFAARLLLDPCPGAYLFSIDELPRLVENPPRP